MCRGPSIHGRLHLVEDGELFGQRRTGPIVLIESQRVALRVASGLDLDQRLADQRVEHVEEARHRVGEPHDAFDGVEVEGAAEDRELVPRITCTEARPRTRKSAIPSRLRALWRCA